MHNPTGGPGMGWKQSKPRFFEKKQQTTFMSWARGIFSDNAPRNQSFFAAFFSKKAVLPACKGAAHA
jgi:hypothetical protein